MWKALRHWLVLRVDVKSKKQKEAKRREKMDIPRTGWPPSLLQDDSKELSKWFASRIDARYVIRKVFNENCLHKG